MAATATKTWADDDQDDDVSSAPVVIENTDGTKTIVEHGVNDENKKIKITRKVRMVLTQHKAKHTVAVRKQWSKFGAAANTRPSFEDGITAIGEEIPFRLAVNKNFDIEEEQLTVAEQVKKLQSTNISCRICKGDHWTTKCPYKDTLQPLEEILDSAANTGPSAEKSGSIADVKSGKYVPPRLRGKGGEGPSESFSARRQLDDTSTVRVTNLSEDTSEADVQALFKRFGPTSRVFLARDRDTGVCKGFAFINYLSREDAARAIEVMNGYGFDNLILHVEWARPTA